MPINKAGTLLASSTGPTSTTIAEKIEFSTDFFHFLSIIFLLKSLLFLSHAVTLKNFQFIKTVYKYPQRFDSILD